ncbi:hypothetical protein [Maribacter sp. Hel_I_7]|uniref:hypothetical protein n=1 Tax=Maribacter sp. Hel_I_7 TaxID=1249997 RepID=UPI0004796F06|nr:hypothetical protein [Maribacter sp. Hel_I_7]
MKNYKKTILLGVFTLAVCTSNISLAANNSAVLKSTLPCVNSDYTNAVFARLVSKINEGFIFNAHVSSSTVKKDGNVELPFTTFGSGPLNLTKGDIIKIENIETSFNDRNNFQSKKTVESMSISSSGNNVKVKMQFHTWSQNVELSNVKITKERFGYFITGTQSNNTKTVYYTIAISHNGRLI